MDDRELERKLEEQLEALTGEIQEEPEDGNEEAGEQTLEDKISAAMEKIVSDTVGDIPVPEQKLPQDAVQEEIIEEEKAPLPVKKGMRTRILCAVLGAVFLAGAGAYGGYAWYNKDKFYRGTVINQVDCSGLTAEQAQELIRKSVEEYALTLKFRGGISEQIRGEDIDYTYIPDGSVAQIKESQSPLLWVKGLFQSEEYQVSENISFNQEKLTQKVAALGPMKEENQQAPQDAYVEYRNSEFVIADEIQGTALNAEMVQETVRKAVAESLPEEDLEAAGAYQKPQILKTDAGLQREREQLNSLAKASVTYQIPNGEIVLDGNTLKNWLVRDSGGNYVKDDAVFEENLRSYVAQLADQVDTLGKDREFTNAYGDTITVPLGNYGWQIDQKSEIAQLRENLDNQEVVTREPAYASREISTENSGLGGTYVEIDLTGQHLWFYQDGEQVFDTDIVSGMMTAKRYTPPGTYTIAYKQKDRVLRGEPVPPDNKPEYETPVDFWMPFNGGIGMHDATWNPYFGGERYVWNGSHGCINLSYSAAKAMYSYVEKGTPVICYYTDDYQSRIRR